MPLDLATARTLESFWVPEAPNCPGFYAREKPKGDGVFQPQHLGTYEIDHAHKFATREECQSWCDANAWPMPTTKVSSWLPVEHAYGPPRST